MRTSGDQKRTGLPDQSGRLAVVTGANSGIGYATATALAQAGATVVLACRNPDLARRAEESMRREVPGADVTSRLVDLADQSSIHAFAATFGGERIDLLVNNAGVALAPRSRTVDGFETHFGVNTLGTFAVTALLLPRLLAAPDPRVVTVSSEAQRFVRMVRDDPLGERRYRPWGAYLRSKQATLHLALELQRRADAAHVHLRSMAASPGLTRSNVLGGGTGGHPVLRRVVGVLGKPARDGALPTLHAATADLPGASYVVPGGPMQQRGAPTPCPRDRAYRDTATAARLWELAVRLTGITPDLGAAGR